MLIRSLGVAQLAVAVNKMDTVSWRQERYEEIIKKLQHFLKQVGFRDADVSYIPCSGFTGDNLVKRSQHMSSWYSGKTLVEAIDSFKPPPRLVEKPFRMSVTDSFKPQSTGICIAGRIESGFVQKEDRILFSPLNELATVKNVLQDDVPITSAFAGDHVCLVVTGNIDQAHIANGMVVCDPAEPVPVAKRFRYLCVVTCSY